MLGGTNKRSRWNSDRGIAQVSGYEQGTAAPGQLSWEGSNSHLKDCLEVVFGGKSILVLFLSSQGEPVQQGCLLQVLARRTALTPSHARRSLWPGLQEEKANQNQGGLLQMISPKLSDRRTYYLWPSCQERIIFFPWHNKQRSAQTCCFGECRGLLLPSWPGEGLEGSWEVRTSISPGALVLSGIKWTAAACCCQHRKDGK